MQKQNYQITSKTTPIGLDLKFGRIMQGKYEINRTILIILTAIEI